MESDTDMRLSKRSEPTSPGEHCKYVVGFRDVFCYSAEPPGRFGAAEFLDSGIGDAGQLRTSKIIYRPGPSRVLCHPLQLVGT